jgi:hypothetical protein
MLSTIIKFPKTSYIPDIFAAGDRYPHERSLGLRRYQRTLFGVRAFPR